MTVPLRGRRLVGGCIAICAIATLGGAVRRVNAQSATANLSGIAHVAIRVGDLERSRAFFHKLGFEEAFALDKGGAPTEAFFKVNDRQFIELYPRRGPDDAVGFMHVCFEAPDLQGLYQDYVNHGLTPTPVKRAGAGNLLFTLQGPEEPGAPSDLRGAVTQNIEYTQYMPGSRHTLDRGQHLGPDRIADRMVGAGIPMTDPVTAEKFYVNKLSFQPVEKALEPESIAVKLPGSPDQEIELLPPAPGDSPALHFHLIFSVPGLRRTEGQLRALGFPAKKHGRMLSIEDPDGDVIVFVEPID